MQNLKDNIYIRNLKSGKILDLWPGRATENKLLALSVSKQTFHLESLIFYKSNRNVNEYRLCKVNNTI